MTSTISFGDANSGFQAGTINGPVNTEFHHHAPPERPETPASPSAMIPFSRDVDFIERGEVLDQIHQKCAVSGSRTALVGLGGVGKSQLAIEYAYRTQDRSFETWVFWVHASNAARFEQSFRDIANSVKISGRRNPRANIFQLVHDWLRDNRKGRWVLILDNLDDAGFLVNAQSTGQDGQANDIGSGKPLVAYLPHCSNGSILITTRSKNAALKLVEQRDIIAIEPMSRADSLTLFKNKLGVYYDGDNIAELAEALEFMPLAIVQAAAFISQSAPRYSVREYLQDFRKSDRKRMSLLSYEGEQLRRDWEANNSIIITWQMSFDHISKTRPSAAGLLSLMSFFDRQGIPEALLRCYKPETSHTHIPEDSDPHEANADNALSETAWLEEVNQINLSDQDRLGDFNGHKEVIDENWSELGHDGESISRNSLSDWSEDSDNDEEDVEENSPSVLSLNNDFESDIAILRNYSFISCTVRQGSFNMHRLVQLSTQKWLEADGQLERWRTQFIMNLCIGFPPAEFEDWDTCQDLYPHATLAVAQQPSENQSLISWASLLHNAAWYASRTGNTRDAKKMSKKALKAREKLFGQEHDETLKSMEMLGSVLYDEYHWKEAEKLQKQVMDTRKRVYGPGHPLTLASIANFALTTSIQGRLDEAAVLQVQILDHLRSTVGISYPDTLGSMGDLASTYYDQGRFKDAEGLQVQVIETYKTKFGADHPNTIAAMASLASTFWRQGRFKDAEGLQVQVIEAYQTKFGTDHLYTLTAMGSLSVIYSSQGQLKNAKDLGVQVIEAFQTKLGADHFDTLAAMSHLAIIYQRQGQFKDAEKVQVQVMEAYQTKLGTDHLKTLSTMGSLAWTYYTQDRLEDAEKIQVQVMEAYQTRLGANNLTTLSAMNNLAVTYSSQGRIKEAEELLEQVMEAYQTKLGADHPDTLTVMGNLALTYPSQGRFEDAKNIQAHVIEARKTKLGADHPNTLTAISHLARTYYKQGRFEDAEELEVQVLKARQTKLGADHPHTLLTMGDLASTYRSLGRFEDAEELEVQLGADQQ